jgi:acyl-CoA synthetase (AMP-forming)/AMP-acid ligase II
MLLSPSTRHHYPSLLAAAALRPEEAAAPALIYISTEAPPIQVSRGDFQRQVLAYAGRWRTAGLGPGAGLLIAQTQGLESIYAFWAALHLGAVPAMFPTLTEKLDPAIYLQNLAAVAGHSQAKAILTTPEFAPLLRQQTGAQVYTEGDLPAGEAGPAHQAEGEAVAFLQHSSGSTGLQKGVALSHRAVLNQLANYSAALDLRPDDVVVSWLPLYHDMGLIAGFLLPLVQGIPLVLMSPFDWVLHPAMLFRAITEYRGTLCWLPNFAYQHCARRIRKSDLAGFDLSTMRAFINCSEPVRHSSHLAFAERFQLSPTQLGVSYAMAENTFAVTQTPPGQAAALDPVDGPALATRGQATPLPLDHPQAQVNVSCGPSIPGTALRILGPGGEALPERQVGEVAVKSDCMLSGYHRRPDLNADLWREGWYLTGDMGYLAGGELYICGRKKDLIITAGKNIYPQDLEAIAQEVPGVHPGRAVAFGVWDEREGTELIGLVAESDQADQAENIAAAIGAAIAARTDVALSYVQVVGPRWLIKTSSGKLARAANRDKWRAEFGEGG